MDIFSVPALVPPATAGNLTNLIAERAWFEPERTMMSRPVGDGWVSVSAREVDEEVRAAAKGLIAAGIQVGDRVALMAKTRYEWTILDFAIWYAGAVTVPIYETSSTEQVQWILSDSEAVAIIVETPALRDVVQPAMTSQCKHIWTITEDAMLHLTHGGRDINDEEIVRRRA